MRLTIPVVRVAAGVVRVSGLNPGPFTLEGTNTYLLGSGERRVLVDTGDGEQADYFTELRKHLGGRARVGRILLTHWHADHIGGVRQLLDSPDIVTPDCTVHKYADAEADGSESVAAMLETARARDRLRGIADGEVFDIDGGLQLRAVFTPGHTSDHMAFAVSLPSSSHTRLLLLTGDTVLGRGSTTVHALGPYMDSLRRLLELQPTTLLPGHGTIVSGRDEDRSNAVRAIEGYIEHRIERERQIAAALAAPPPPRNGAWRVDEVAAAVYTDVTDPPLVLAAQNNCRLHLDKLVRDGSAELRHADGVDLYAIKSPS
ncbi:Beta-lactamase-like protein 2 [Coemansia helicoidea]|uniref:Beta-lactamase-like protein 2 n=1 Tax=Coemansia helicoidea TaxID=1286919 RepID=A0ACC1LCI1_9FUNG|nr:Beta-lactamase-like protein 2 [Coemansia helicoidea]